MASATGGAGRIFTLLLFEFKVTFANYLELFFFFSYTSQLQIIRGA